LKRKLGGLETLKHQNIVIDNCHSSIYV